MRFDEFPMAAVKFVLQGALWGEIVSVVVMCWLIFTTKVYEANGIISAPKLPVSVDGCMDSINITQV